MEQPGAALLLHLGSKHEPIKMTDGCSPNVQKIWLATVLQLAVPMDQQNALNSQLIQLQCGRQQQCWTSKGSPGCVPAELAPGCTPSNLLTALLLCSCPFCETKLLQTAGGTSKIVLTAPLLCR